MGFWVQVRMRDKVRSLRVILVDWEVYENCKKVIVGFYRGNRKLPNPKP